MVQKKDTRDLVLNHLKKYGSTISWLSKETGIPYNTLYAILKLKTTNISEERMISINNVLGTKFKK